MGFGRGWAGWACIGIQLNYSKTGPWLQLNQRMGRVGPVRAEWGRVGPSRAEWGRGRGWYSKTRPWLQGWAKWGQFRVGPSRAE